LDRFFSFLLSVCLSPPTIVRQGFLLSESPSWGRNSEIHRPYPVFIAGCAPNRFFSSGADLEKNFLSFLGSDLRHIFGRGLVSLLPLCLSGVHLPSFSLHKGDVESIFCTFFPVAIYVFPYGWTGDFSRSFLEHSSFLPTVFILSPRRIAFPVDAPWAPLFFASWRLFNECSFLRCVWRFTLSPCLFCPRLTGPPQSKSRRLTLQSLFLGTVCMCNNTMLSPVPRLSLREPCFVPH